jgi:hypothetical protein
VCAHTILSHIHDKRDLVKRLGGEHMSSPARMIVPKPVWPQPFYSRICVCDFSVCLVFKSVYLAVFCIVCVCVCVCARARACERERERERERPGETEGAGSFHIRSQAS